MKNFIIKVIIVGIIAFFAWQGYKALNKGRVATNANQNVEAEDMLNR